MTEHHEGHLYLTGDGNGGPNPPQQTVNDGCTVVGQVVTDQHMADLTNILLRAGRDIDKLANDAGYTHKDVLDALRDAPRVSSFYDAAHHGEPDMTAEAIHESYVKAEEKAKVMKEQFGTPTELTPEQASELLAKLFAGPKGN